MFNYAGSIHYYLLLLRSAFWNYFGKNILIHCLHICFCTCLHSWHETGKWTSILVWKMARFGRTICPEDSLFLNKLFHLEEIYYGQFNCLTISEFLTGDPFQLIHQFWRPSLDAFEWLHIFFSYGHSAPGEASLMWGQWDGHLSWLVMLCLMHTGWGLSSGCSGHTLGPAVDQHPTSLSAGLFSSHSQFMLVPGITLS